MFSHRQLKRVALFAMFAVTGCGGSGETTTVIKPEPAYQVSGTVTDGKSDTGVEAAIVSSDDGRQTVTNHDGNFTFRLSPGVRTLTVAAAGYAVAVQKVDVKKAAVLAPPIKLTADSDDGTGENNNNDGGTTEAPALVNVQPSVASGNQTVTLTGTRFTANTAATGSLRIGSFVGEIVSWSDTSVVMRVPPTLPAGSYTVLISVDGKDSGALPFTVAPAIVTVSPPGGSAGDSVTLTGTNFSANQAAGTVTIGGVVASVSAWSSSTIVVAVPAGVTGGNQTVLVTVGGVSAPAASFAVRPAIANVNPGSGSGGDAIMLTGTHFGSSQGAGTVSLGGTLATVAAWSNTSITFTLPGAAAVGNQSVTVTVGGQASNTAALAVVPKIANLAPASGAGGDLVTVTGTNFGASQATSALTIGGVAAVVSSWSNTTISASVPAALPAGNYSAVLTVNGVTSNAAPFGVKSIISGLGAAVAYGGASLTILGTGFGASQGGSSVSIGGVLAAVTAWSNTAITVTIPDTAAAGAQNVAVSVSGVASNTASVRVAPSVASLSPAFGVAGASITIAGSNFGSTQGSSAITLGGVSPSVLSWGNNAIVVSVPAMADPGNKNTSVTVAGEASNTAAFDLRPAIASITPTRGGAGSVMTITGSAFGTLQGSSTVTFGGTAASVVSWSGSTVVVNVPALSTGNYDVVITANGAASNGVQFGVGPLISSLSVAALGVSETLTINGSGFGAAQGGSSVSIGGVSVAVGAWSSGAISLVLPDTVPGGSQDVVVTASGVTSNLYAVTVKPTLTTLSPGMGAKDTLVTITGSNFGPVQGVGRVLIGGVDASVQGWSANSISAWVPAGLAVGGVNTQVVIGTAASNTQAFTIMPGISLLTPSSGAVTGTALAIQGSSFGSTQVASSVSVGGVNAAVSGWSNSLVSVVIPTSLAPGAQNVVVTVGGQASAPAAVVLRPSIISVTPEAAVAGNLVSFHGGNFGASQGANVLYFGGTPVAVASWTNSAVDAVIPANLAAGAWSVSARVNGQTSNAMILVVRPALTSVSPSSGATGSALTLLGSGFGASQGASTVSIGGVAAPIGTWSDTAITAYLPGGIATGNNATVVSVGGQASVSVSVDVFPSIINMNPALGQAGSSVTLTGTSFGTSQGASTITVGGVAATITGWADGAAVLTVPSGLAPGSHNVAANVAGHASNGMAYVIRPGLSALSLSVATGGNTLTLTGTGFSAAQGGSSVLIAGIPTTVTAWSDTSISVTVPNSVPPGTQSVNVRVNAIDSAVLTLTIAPSLAGLSPGSGSAGGTVVLTGANFGATQNGGSVNFAGGLAVVSNWSSTSISVQVPGSAGTGAQTVFVTAGGQNSGLQSFTVTVSSGPVISGVTPNSGPLGTAITLSGSNLGASQGSSTLTVGGVPATVTAWSSSSIGAVVPSGLANGSQSIVVTVSGQSSNTAMFTIVPPGAPALSSLSAASGGVGSSLTISGSNFGGSQGAGFVTVGGVTANVSAWTAASITITIPALSAGEHEVIVTASSQPSNALTFTVVAVGAPWILAIAPQTGTGNTSITITGANFGAPQGQNLVNIGGIPAFVTSWSATSITFLAPSNAMVGNVEVQAWVNGFHSNIVYFTHQRPWIDSYYPLVGTTGTSVVVYGRYFGATTGMVTVGGALATVQGWTPKAVQFQIPSNTPSGKQNVILYASWGQSSNAVPYTQRRGNTWLTMGTLGASNSLAERAYHSAVWTGSEMIVWGGKTGAAYSNQGARYNPVFDTWQSLNYAGAPTGRTEHAVVWTGAQMLVWGGYNGSYLGDGGRYDPVTDTWSAITATGAPTPRRYHSAIWTGREMVVWGGDQGGVYLNTGAEYDPNLNTWTNTGTGAFVPAARSRQTAVWTGSEMVVWGGYNGSYLNTGSRYNVNTNAWSPMSVDVNTVPNVRAGHGAVYTGSEILIWGGYNGAYLADGARYSLQNDTWAPIAAGPSARENAAVLWTGQEMIVDSGDSGSGYAYQGGRYDPITNIWNTIDSGWNTIGESVVSTGEELIIWGGVGAGSGRRYHLASATWTGMGDASFVPTARSGHGAVWTGSEMLVWGGGQTPGGRYDAAIDEWLPMDTTGQPNSTTAFAVWDGSTLVVFNGSDFYTYNPATDSWSTPVDGGIYSRISTAMVWTGSEAIVWGGHSGSSYFDSGARFNSTTRTVLPTSMVNAPQARTGQSAVWTGAEMIVSGGQASGLSGMADARYVPSGNYWTVVTPPTSYTPFTPVLETFAGASAYATWSFGGNWGRPGFDAMAEEPWSDYANNASSTALYRPIITPTATGQINFELLLYAQGAGNDYLHVQVNAGSGWTTLASYTGYIYWVPYQISLAAFAGQDIQIRFLLTTDGAVTDGGPYIDDFQVNNAAGKIPVTRYNHSAVWTGTQMLMWGGTNGTDLLNTGYRYTPANGVFTALPTADAPTARTGQSAVWTGTHMIVWGGNDAGGSVQSGGLFNAALNTWVAGGTSLVNVPSARFNAPAVWTGQEMLVWGGTNGSSQFDSGERYAP